MKSSAWTSHTINKNEAMFPLEVHRTCPYNVRPNSVRFVKKNHWGGGSPTGERVKAPQALTCNTNTGVWINPPGDQIDGDSGGQKKSLGGLNPPTPRQIGPCGRSRSFGRRGRTSTEVRPNISVLWQVFDNTLNTLQFHQNTTLQLYNVYKKLWRIKLFSVAATHAS